MKLLACCFMLVFLMASSAIAGELYGTITEAGKPVAAGIKIEIVVAGKSVAGETDKFGTYHIFATEKGKGTLTANYRDQKLTVDIFSYDKSTRYDWTVEVVDGKMMLKRR
jgi:hypothetical protein